MQELLPLANPVHKVTILPRGQALGLTWGMPNEEKYLTTRQEFFDNIASFLGGRVAEQIVFNESTTGASNDLDRATDMARSMVTEYGMSPRLGTLKIGNRQDNPFLGRSGPEERNYSEEVARAIDEEIRAIMDSCYETAQQILTENRELMDRIAAVLLEKESIERDEFLALMQGAKAPEGRKPRESRRSDGGHVSSIESPTDTDEIQPTPKRPVSLPGGLQPGIA